MADYVHVCGTGGHGSFPVPGDPDLNNRILNAIGITNGIRVFWDYPDVRPEAVAHTILYRSTSGTEATKVRHQLVSGDFYIDMLDPDNEVTYYYWIQMVSVNGTIGDLIGPASATARPSIERLMQILTGQIQATQLASDLATPIAEIPTLKTDIGNEAVARSTAISGLYTAIDALETGLVASVAQYESDVVQYRDDTTAVVGRFDTFLAGVNEADGLATIIQSEVAAVGGGVSEAQVDTKLDAALQNSFGTSDTAALQTTWNTLVTAEAASASYMTQTEVNGLLGGFGIYNDGTNVTSIFDVDRFALGRLKSKIEADLVTDWIGAANVSSGTTSPGYTVYVEAYGDPVFGSLTSGEVTFRIPQYPIPDGHYWDMWLVHISDQGNQNRYFEPSSLGGAATIERVAPSLVGEYWEATFSRAEVTSDPTGCYGIAILRNSGGSIVESVFEPIGLHLTNANGGVPLVDIELKPTLMTRKVGGFTSPIGATITPPITYLNWLYDKSEPVVDKTYPFLYDSDTGQVMIDDLMVNTLTVEDVFAETISVNAKFSAAEITGGSIDINGKFIVGTDGLVTIKTATTNTSRLEMTNDVIKIFNGSEAHPRVTLGNLA